MRARRTLVVWLACALAGCHVVTYHELTRAGRVERTRKPGNAGQISRPPTLVVDPQGRLRFVVPLACPTDEVVEQHRGNERVVKPNIATFVVGILGTSIGAIALTNGLANGDAAKSPYTYAGAALLAGGIPLAIGPWIGRGRVVEPLPDGPPLHRAGPFEPCGERALVASTALVKTRGIEVFGSIDRDGVFAVSPFAVLDAFQTKAMPSLDVAATLVTPDGARTIETIVDGSTLAGAAPAFLASAGFDTTVDAMRLVPNLVAGTLRASLASVDGAPMLRLVLPIENAGPGPSYQLRGHVTAPGTPAIDGRILYIGHVPKGSKLVRELLVPLAPAAADALRNATLEIGIELRDAHGTAPATPVRFQGPVLVDAPR